MNRSAPVLLTLVLFAALPHRVAAADGRIPIASAPFTISAPGHYYLTADLTVASGSAITLAAVSGVDLDLGGHTLTVSTGTAPVIAVGNVNGLLLHNGRLNGPAGIVINPGGATPLVNHRYEKLAVRATAIGGSAFSHISGVLYNVLVRDCQLSAEGASGTGAGFSSSFIIQGGRIENNLIRVPSMAYYGIYLANTTNATLQGNSVVMGGSGAGGMRLDFGNDCKISGNLLNGPGITGNGIELLASRYSTVTDNTVANWSNGILLNNSSGSVSEANVIERNAIARVVTGLVIFSTNINNTWSRNRVNGFTTAYSVAAGNLSAGDNCDQTACNR